MEIPLDQFFLVKYGHSGPDFGYGPFTTVKSWKFWKLPKIDFFLSERLANGCVGRFLLKFLDKTLKLAEKSRFQSFLADFVIFDRFRKRQNKPGISRPKSTFCGWFIKFTYKSPPGSWELNCKCLKIFRENILKFWKNFVMKNLAIFTSHSC